MSFQHVSSQPRAELDHYPTIDQDLTRAILHRLHRHSSIWEPCCGTGEMADILLAEGKYVFCSDIKDYGYENHDLTSDFLETTTAPVGVTAIVTNPPFGREAEQVIRHAIKLMEPVGGSVFMLLRFTWDSAKTRQDLYRWPLVAKHNLMWRPYWKPKKPGDSGPQHNYSWFEWDWSANYCAAPRNKYLNKPEQ